MGTVREDVDFEVLIPSKEVREQMTLQKLTDVELASLINNEYRDWEERISLLEKLMAETVDEALAVQISMFVRKEKETLRIIRDNGNKDCVYALTINEYDDENEEYGLFVDYETAVRYGKISGFSFSIEKRPVLGLGEHKTYSSEELGVNPLTHGEHNDDGQEIGYISFAKNGRIEYLYLREEFAEGTGRETDEVGKDLLNHYVDVYNPFDAGDIVQMVDNDTFLGVVVTSNEEWNEYHMRALGKAENPKGFTYDYSDVQIIVDEVDEVGYTNHRHVSPARLMKADEKNSDSRWDLVSAMSSVSKGTGDYQWLLMNYDPFVMKRLGI